MEAILLRQIFDLDMLGKRFALSFKLLDLVAASALRHLVDSLARSGQSATRIRRDRDNGTPDACASGISRREMASVHGLADGLVSVQQRVGTVDRIGVECVVLVKEAD